MRSGDTKGRLGGKYAFNQEQPRGMPARHTAGHSRTRMFGLLTSAAQQV